jgi:Subtilase family/Peptidase inhibitor I9
MKSVFLKFVVTVTAVTFFGTACRKSASEQNAAVTSEPELTPAAQEQPVAGRYIIHLADAPVERALPALGATTQKGAEGYAEGQRMMETYTKEFLAANRMANAKVTQVYAHALKGFVAELSIAEANSLRLNPAVASVEQDMLISVPTAKVAQDNKPVVVDGQAVTASNAVPLNFFGGQGLTFPVSKAGGAGNGVGRRIFIVDSGVDPAHADLTVNAALSRNFITVTASVPTSSQNPGLNDNVGHGTAVAGMAAARNNTTGVVGVAAGATLIGVKVTFPTPGLPATSFDAGVGFVSDIIAGVNYVRTVAVAGEVANLSLGSGFNAAFNTAVTNLANAGVYVVVAAGNSAVNVSNVRVIVVSAVDRNNVFAPFSNFGANVDFAQDGVNTASTYPLNRLIVGISGTSFSAPVVAGVLTLNKTPRIVATAIGDPDGIPDRIPAWR